MRLKVIYAGYLIEPLRALIAMKQIEVAGVITEAWRKPTLSMEKFAKSKAIKTYSLERSLANDDTLAEISRESQLGIVAGFGVILDRAIQAPLHGWLNIHPGELPKYRGNRPLENQIADRRPGVSATIHRLVREIDAGPIYFSACSRLRPGFTYVEALAAAMEIASDALPSVIQRVVSGYPGIVQDPPSQPKARLFSRSLMQREKGVIRADLSAAITQYRIEEKPVDTVWNGSSATLRRIYSLPSNLENVRRPCVLLKDLVESLPRPIVSIMQPTFSPWMGFFDLIDKVDLFVFLDDAQFSKGSFHSRNVFENRKGDYRWISVPCHRPRQGFFPSLQQVTLVSPEKFLKRFLNSLRHEFPDSPHREDIEGILAQGLSSNHSLAQSNMSIIESLTSLMEIRGTFVKSSSLGAKGGRSQRVAEILREVGAKSYLATPGAQEYMAKDKFTELSDVEIYVNNYKPVTEARHIGQSSNSFYPCSISTLLSRESAPRTELIAGRMPVSSLLLKSGKAGR